MIQAKKTLKKIDHCWPKEREREREREREKLKIDIVIDKMPGFFCSYLN